MKLNLRNNFDRIFNHFFYVLPELLIKRWVAMSRPSLCYDRVWTFESGCNRNRLELVSAGECGPDLLVLVHLSGCAGCPIIHSQAPTGNQSAEWTGHPYFTTQASLSQSAETKQSPPQEHAPQPATNLQAGQSAPKGTTPASQLPSPASSCRNANEQLAAEVSSAVIAIIGAERPDAQCQYNIRTKVASIISRYSVSAEGKP